MKPVIVVSLLVAGVLACRGEIIDRVAAIVGRQMITWSEVQREARLEAYFNGSPAPGRLADESPEYREVLERLIEQRLIRQEMDQARFPEADDSEAKEWLGHLGGVRAKPADYGLREADLLEYGRRLARTDKFLELRFNRSVTSLVGGQAAPAPALAPAPANEEQHEIDHWLKDLRARLGVRILQPEAP